MTFENKEYNNLNEISKAFACFFRNSHTTPVQINNLFNNPIHKSTLQQFLVTILFKDIEISPVKIVNPNCVCCCITFNSSF